MCDWSELRMKACVLGLLGCVVLVMVGCAGPSRLPAVTDSITVPVRFVNAGGDPISRGDRPENQSLFLGAIVGAMVGSPGLCKLFVSRSHRQ